MLIKVPNKDPNQTRIIDPLEEYDSQISQQADDNKRAAKRISVRQLREIAEANQIHGVACKFKVDENEGTVTVTYSRWRGPRSSTFSLSPLPFESQAVAGLRALANLVRC